MVNFRYLVEKGRDRARRRHLAIGRRGVGEDTARSIAQHGPFQTALSTKPCAASSVSYRLAAMMSMARFFLVYGSTSLASAANGWSSPSLTFLSLASWAA